MKKNSVRQLYLSLMVLFFLFACNLPTTLGEAKQDDAEAPSELGESEMQAADDAQTELNGVDLDALLGVGTSIEWFDKGFLVFVPKGVVTLGDNDYEDNPVHSVYLDDYWIYTFKVTNGQYHDCMQTGTCSPLSSKPPYPDITDPEIKDYPVVGVTWEQARTYCEWMNASLPTEAQWEKAARGPENNTYPWGKGEPTCELLNFGDCEYRGTTKVFKFPYGISFYEAYDLAGNTFEWTKDWYQADYPANAPNANPLGPENGTERSVRGSGFKSNIDELDSAQRAYLDPTEYRPDLGFRCVVTDLEPFAPYCIQAAYAPGSPVPWQPGHPPGDTPPDPDFGEGDCLDWGAGLDTTEYCAYEETQQGGLNLEPIYSATIESWNSDEGVVCVEGDPFACLGPDNAHVTINWCATCTPDPISVFEEYTCAPGYELNYQTDPMECTYPGIKPTAEEIAQWEICPSGFIYDGVNDICINIMPASKECPQGYVFDEDAQCCVANFAAPNPELGETPPYSYLACPIGSVFDWSEYPTGVVLCKFEVIFPPIVYCHDAVMQVGDCPDPPEKKDDDPGGCTNPGQYSSQSPCEAAGCIWFTESATGGAYCKAS